MSHTQPHYGVSSKPQRSSSSNQPVSASPPPPPEGEMRELSYVPEIFEITEEMPRFPGCESEIEE